MNPRRGNADEMFDSERTDLLRIQFALRVACIFGKQRHKLQLLRVHHSAYSGPSPKQADGAWRSARLQSRITIPHDVTCLKSVQVEFLPCWTCIFLMHAERQQANKAPFRILPLDQGYCRMCLLFASESLIE